MDKKAQAQDWFRDLRDRIVQRFEDIEATYSPNERGQQTEPAMSPRSGAPLGGQQAEQGAFKITSWQRQEEGGGGEMGMMKGRVFEKVGVNISTVTGEFSEQFRKEIPGASADPRFWASGISLVAHMASPKVPAAHFNTRMIVVGDEARLWFGGGGDLNPMVENPEDTKFFHAAFQKACDDAASRASTAMSPRHASHALNARAERSGAQASPAGDLPKQLNFYDAFASWCEEYFYIPHRNETRGVGGIFYDYLGLNTLGSMKEPIAPGQFGKGGVGKERTAAGMEVASNAPMDWQQCFDFTKAVGEAFLFAYPAIIEARMNEPFTKADREHQLRKRGRYAEYNLLYDRGTRFGLMTGGNPEAILMSLPPIAKWD